MDSIIIKSYIDNAIALAELHKGKITIEMIQREFNFGYLAATAMLDELKRRGYVDENL